MRPKFIKNARVAFRHPEETDPWVPALIIELSFDEKTSELIYWIYGWSGRDFTNFEYKAPEKWLAEYTDSIPKFEIGEIVRYDEEMYQIVNLYFNFKEFRYIYSSEKLIPPKICRCLVDEGDDENPNIVTIKKPKYRIGSIVQAKAIWDNHWYLGQVVDIKAKEIVQAKTEDWYIDQICHIAEDGVRHIYEIEFLNWDRFDRSVDEEHIRDQIGVHEEILKDRFIIPLVKIDDWIAEVHELAAIAMNNEGENVDVDAIASIITPLAIDLLKDDVKEELVTEFFRLNSWSKSIGSRRRGG